MKDKLTHSYGGPEYAHVVKPFLDELENVSADPKAKWRVIDFQGNIPATPEATLRTHFQEIILKDEFFKKVKEINKTDKGKTWLEDDQLQELYESLQSTQLGSLIEINEAMTQLLYKTTVDENRLTGEKDPTVHLIDFSENGWTNNSFIAITEFKIDTPGKVKQHIRPDIVLFVNGIPLVVVECKYSDAQTVEPMHEAVTQLRRYSDQRDDNMNPGLREGEPKLFYTNQLLIAACGRTTLAGATTEAKVGSITSTIDYFFHWKDSYPTPLSDLGVDLKSLPSGKEERVEEKGRLLGQQKVLIHGMLHPRRLLDITRTFILFPTLDGRKIKVIPRYQQYRATLKAVRRFSEGKNSVEKSGVIWHTQGSGKSFTMVYVVRKIRQMQELKEFKIILVNDRIDLEEQLTETAALTGEKVYEIRSSEEAKTKLKTDTSNLNMVMVHKFHEAQDRLPEYAAQALRRGPVQFKKFGVVNDSAKILLMVDEAHRSQGAGTEFASLSDNLFNAFPNAIKVAFTGTPLMHKTKDGWQTFGKTAKRFGQYIDTYKINESVEDGATVQILYEGKTANVAVRSPREFERKFEDLFKDRTPAELKEIKKRYGTTDDIFEAEERIKEIAFDIVEHYTANILPNGFKAQVVTSSKIAALRYRKHLDLSIGQKIEECANDPAKSDLSKQLAFLKTAVVISSDGTNEDPAITEARKRAQETNAVENFKKSFNYDRPETGMAILVVCDMLLTGFDAPVEQVMYIDKKIQEHNLLQAIARVNRTKPGKNAGYIVDYIGLTNYLKEALSIYSTEDIADIDEYLRKVEAEIPVVERRYQRLINFFEEQGIPSIEDLLTQEIQDLSMHSALLEECVELLEDIKLRETFSVFFNKFCQSMDIVLPNPAGEKYQIPMYQLSLIQNEVRMRYRDETMSFVGVGKKIRDLINQHLIGRGIDPAIQPTPLLSDDFIKEIQKRQTARARASEMEHAIRKHCRVNRDSDPVFYDKLLKKIEELIKQYEEDWERLIEEFEKARAEAAKGRKPVEDGVSGQEAPFFDLVSALAFGDTCPPEHKATLIAMIQNTIELLQSRIDIVNFWQKPDEVDSLKALIKVEAIKTQVDAIKKRADKIASELADLAKHREEELLRQKS